MSKPPILIAGLVFLCGCQLRPDQRSSMPYSIVKIEMAVMDERARHRRSSPSLDWPYSVSDFRDRVHAAGRAAIPELAFALESPNPTHRSMAGDTLRAMTGGWNWPEAWEFVLQRLRMIDRITIDEFGQLLYAVAQERVREHPELLLWSAPWLDEEDVVVNVLIINHPENRTEMRVCDYAAYVVQLISGVDFGALPRTNDLREEILEKARAWVRENMEQEMEGKTRYTIPEWLRKKETEGVKGSSDLERTGNTDTLKGSRDLETLENTDMVEERRRCAKNILRDQRRNTPVAQRKRIVSRNFRSQATCLS